MNVKALGAEFVGTLWLVLGGCGAAVLAANFVSPSGVGPDVNIGYVGVALAFGLTVLTGIYAFGHVSGGHFNPAVTVGLVVGKRFDPKEAIGYIVAQVLGGILGAAILFGIASGVDGWDPGSFASNGYDEWSPGRYNLGSVMLVEVVLTAVFVLVILGATARSASPGFAGIGIGLCLTLIHLVSIPVSNTSVNPARSTAPALFAGGDQIAQLWVFWLAPLAGGVLGALVHLFFLQHDEEEVAQSPAA